MQLMKLKDLEKHRVVTLVCGEIWVLEVLPEKVFSKTEHPDNSDVGSHGVCYKDGSNKILFNGGVNIRLIIHELFHAYTNYFFLNSTNDVGRDDFEEIICEMLELNLASFQFQVRKVAAEFMGKPAADKEWRALLGRKKL